MVSMNKERNEILSQNLDIVKTLNSKPRLRALLLLFIYRKLSLSELSKLLGKSKNTIVYHMKMMVDHGLILESDQIIENSIKPLKNYELSSDFYEKVFINFEELENLPDNEIKTQSRNIFKWNTLLFETIKEFLGEVSSFYDKNEKELDSASKIINFHQKNHIPRDLIPLSENGYNEYMKLYSDFMEKTMILLEKEEKMEKITRPYLAFNMILPIKNLVEFRLNKVNK